MTNPPRDSEVPEVAPHEELASALVDREATPAEEPRAAEPHVAAAAGTYRVVAARVGEPVDAPAAIDRERVLAAALDVFDREVRRPAPAAVDLRAARRDRWRAPQWLGAVAAALVILAGLGLLAGLAGGGDDDSGEVATAERDDGTEQTTSADEELDSAGSAAGAGAEAYSAALPYLGEFDDLDSLVVVAGADLATRAPQDEQAAERPTSADAATTTAAAAPSPAPVPCTQAIGAESPDRLVVGTATVEGRAATVVVETDDDGARSVVVYTEPDCAPVAVPLDD